MHQPGQQIVHKGAGTQKLNAVKLRLALSPFLLLFLPSASYKVVSIWTPSKVPLCINFNLVSSAAVKVDVPELDVGRWDTMQLN